MHKIMIVDDEAVINMQLEERLKFMGYEIVGRAYSGKEAIKIAKSLRPDLILMDIVMPGELDGISASEIIKKELDIPIVFLTAYGDDKYIKRVKNVEPFGYIIKPYKEDQIKATIEIALQKKEMERRLHELLEQYRASLSSINYGIISVDGHGNIIFWNRGAEKLFGYELDEVVSKKLTLIMPEFDMNRIVSIIESDVIEKSFETSGLKKDGSEFPLELSLATWNLKGETFFTCIVRDITDSKITSEKIQVSLKEKELLLRETHHRVKNNLQVISSLLNLQARYIKDKEALEAFRESRERVRSMALIHSQLYQSDNISQIDFAEYIRALVAHLFRLYGVNANVVKPKVNVDGIFLGLETAIPCGLIINELVSNSLKYAFPEGKEGEIRIEIRLDGGHFILIVSDNGIGLPEDLDFRNTESLGLQLVNTLAEDQLQGKIRLDRTEGTEFQIKFKVSNHE